MPGQPASDAVDEDDVPPGGFSRQPHGGGGAGHNILVAVRCRRLLAHETQAGGKAVIKVTDGRTVVLEDPHTTAADDYLRLNKSKERRYTFDEAFDEHVDTYHVYERTTRFLIGGVLQGFNATVFAYGATSAGKTHTMLGSPSSPGIMMLTLQDLFAEVASQRPERQFEVKCSFLEVYNENVRDLLRPDTDYLDIREDPIKGMCVAGISEVGGLESAGEIMALLHQANRHRTTEATGANVTSSRSHAVLQVVVEQRDRTADIMVQVNLGKLSMIDLAGSERAAQTNNKGLRMIEGANINRSLLALGNCITALSSGVAFVPYRDSKMTRLLKDSLGGNCRTAMIANVSPCHLNYEDTHNTLKYANRAKNIKTKAVRNVIQVNYHVSKYTEIIKELRGEITELKAKLATPGPGWSLSLQAEAVNDGLTLTTDMTDVQSVSWQQELLQNIEERVQIKRRLIDFAHQAKNQMHERSHAQVDISQWESSVQQAGDSAHEVTPRSIRELQDKLRRIKTELAQTEESTRELEMMLVENHQRAEKLQMELPRRVQNKDMRAFLGLVSKIYVMEVENMDLQEMNDVSGPLIEQKDLEAEALRLQIQMRDRLIEEQDQLLHTEHQASLPKPEGWLDVPSKPLKRRPSSLQWRQEDGPGFGTGSPSAPESRRRTASVVSQPQASDSMGYSESPIRRRDRFSSMDSVETTGSVVLPPLSPTRGRLAHVSPGPERERGRARAVMPPGHSVTPPSTPPEVESGGKGLVFPSSSSSSALHQVPAQFLQFPLRSPVDGDSESKLPMVEGRPWERKPPSSSLLGIYGSAPSPVDGRPRPPGVLPRRHRKKVRRKNSSSWSYREKVPNSDLQIEACGLHRDDNSHSQGSGSEREHHAATPPRRREPRAAKGDNVANTPWDAAMERRGIIEKLNCRMKSGSTPVITKHLC